MSLIKLICYEREGGGLEPALDLGKVMRDWFLIGGKLFWGSAAQWRIWKGGGVGGCRGGDKKGTISDVE